MVVYRAASGRRVVIPRFIVPCLVLALVGFPAGVDANGGGSTEQVDAASAAAPEVAATTGPNALIGTVGFRSASSSFLGYYVTTGISVRPNGEVRSRDPRVRAREDASVLLFEMGLFRDAAGRFKLLAENGRWLTFQAGVIRASASRWADAWAFRVWRAEPLLSQRVRKSLRAGGRRSLAVPAALPVCIDAYQSGRRKGLLVLDAQGFLVVDPGAACGTTPTSLFMTDDLPTGTAVSALLRKPAQPVDPITKARFVPPDRPARTLTPAQRRSAVNEINAYFDQASLLNARIFGRAHVDVGDIVTDLSVTDKKIPGEDGAAVADWWGIAKEVLSTAVDLVAVAKYAKFLKAGVSITLGVAQMGYNVSQNAKLQGPRVVPGVTTELVETAGELTDILDREETRTGKNLEALKVSLKEGCAKPWTTVAVCPSDRRLAQWLSDPAVFPDRTQTYFENQALAYRRTFYERLLPLRGALIDTWLFVPDGCTGSEPFTREEIISNFLERDRMVAMTSVWDPWHNVYTCGGVAEKRPLMQAWAIGLTGDGEEDTKLPNTVYSDLFNAYDPSRPLTGGLGLTYKEVACQWLTKAPSGYFYENHRYHPCHFSFYDPSDRTPSLINNPDRWVGPDANSASDYARESAVVWYVPERAEVKAGRRVTDPDIFSWQIPRLQYRACTANPRRSTASGTGASVYIANLTQEAVRVRRVNANGTRTTVATVPRWSGLQRPLTGSGAVVYSALTPAIVHLDSFVGATYEVRTVGSDTCIGTYTVNRPPAAAVGYQLAEVHGRGSVRGILELGN